MNMENLPKRRGRRPREVAPAKQEAPQTSQTAVEPAKRRRRAATGGFHLKLTVPQREGFQRRWFNDTPGRLAEAEELAYTHVTDRDIKSDSPDSRVRRLVGTDRQGAPLYAYLMETPLEEFAAGISEKEEAHRIVDEHIRAGRDATGRVQDAYGEGSIGER